MIVNSSGLSSCEIRPHESDTLSGAGVETTRLRPGCRRLVSHNHTEYFVSLSITIPAARCTYSPIVELIKPLWPPLRPDSLQRPILNQSPCHLNRRGLHRPRRNGPRTEAGPRLTPCAERVEKARGGGSTMRRFNDQSTLTPLLEHASVCAPPFGAMRNRVQPHRVETGTCRMDHRVFPWPRPWASSVRIVGSKSLSSTVAE